MDKLIITPDETKVIQMGLAEVIESITETMKNPAIPFNPEARKSMKQILTVALSASKKIEAISGVSAEMEPYKEGDENEFLTKES